MRCWRTISCVKGIYILGKAATLNGSIGDVMISNVVLDEHSQNTYWLDNCFSAADVSKHLVFGAVLDNQKAVSSKGTFLQNRAYLDFYYRANYSVVEMEAGPYLDAVYESLYMTRYPTNENINFAKLPFDLGIIHYASDTPYTRGKNLGRGQPLLLRHGLDLRRYHRHRAAHLRAGAHRSGGATRRRGSPRRGVENAPVRSGPPGDRGPLGPLVGALEFTPAAPPATRCLPARRPGYRESR